jgi:hypothetical protein
MGPRRFKKGVQILLNYDLQVLLFNKERRLGMKRWCRH